MDHPSANPLAGPRLWDRAAPDYLRDVAPGLALFVPDALGLAGLAAGMRVADVACGPGSLSFAAAAAGAHVSALDFSAEMVRLVSERARREARDGVEVRVGDGMALPWPDAHFDAAFSLFGVIFFPDRGRGLRELRRVVRSGGCAVVSSWVAADKVPVIADVWAVLAAEFPSLPYTRVRPVLGDPQALEGELAAAGFERVEVHEIRHELAVPSVLDYWRSLERSTPPIIAARESAPETRWASVREAIDRRLEERFGTGPQRVPLIALLGVGHLLP
jgi:ubiquinone/menaquinone biosynthesis C-methylase UbiE